MCNALKLSFVRWIVSKQQFLNRLEYISKWIRNAMPLMCVCVYLIRKFSILNILVWRMKCLNRQHNNRYIYRMVNVVVWLLLLWWILYGCQWKYSRVLQHNNDKVIIWIWYSIIQYWKCNAFIRDNAWSDDELSTNNIVRNVEALM